ncbi:MAG: nucleotidyl transferase AbiEii/AbiGii toxin family protein, partial [Nocardioidaceae bacterium]
DIDLIALDHRGHTARLLERELPRSIRREYPGTTWQPPLTRVRGSEPATLHTPDGTVVRIQLLTRTGYPTWPTRRAELVQRYSDAPAATLTVPTEPAFVAWKTIAWLDRHTPRDLYDLWRLAQAKYITAEAAALFAEHGPTNKPPRPDHFGTAPADDHWRRELTEQTRLTITANEALAQVRHAWQHAT